MKNKIVVSALTVFECERCNVTVNPPSGGPFAGTKQVICQECKQGDKLKIKN